jgi:RNA polymerase sigma-70 factor (ECF subfamily)
MTDKELIRLYLWGDDDALNILLRRHHKPIYNYVFKLVGTREDAEDLTQMIFIRCYRNLKKLKDPERFLPWLYQIAVNLIRDFWRRRKETMVSLDDDCEERKSWENILISDHNPSLTMEAEQRAELVRRALNMVSMEQREVLVLKVYQGLKFIEIAEVLNEPLNTVKSRLYYGLTAMKKIFQEWKLEEIIINEM